MSSGGKKPAARGETWGGEEINLLHKWILIRLIARDPALVAVPLASVVAGELLEFYDSRTGECFPASRTIGGLVHRHHSVIARVAGALCGANYFFIVKGNRRVSNRYKPNWTRLAEWDPEDKSLSHSEATKHNQAPKSLSHSEATNEDQSGNVLSRSEATNETGALSHSGAVLSHLDPVLSHPEAPESSLQNPLIQNPLLARARESTPPLPKKHINKIGLEELSLTSEVLNDFAAIAPDLDRVRTLAEFRDYYRSKPARISDWRAAFRNWMRRGQQLHDQRKSTAAMPLNVGGANTEVDALVAARQRWRENGEIGPKPRPEDFVTAAKPVMNSETNNPGHRS